MRHSALFVVATLFDDRVTAGGLCYLGIISVAFWRTVLSAEDHAYRDDGVCINSDYCGFHHRALGRHLPSSESSLLLQTVEVRYILKC